MSNTHYRWYMLNRQPAEMTEMMQIPGGALIRTCIQTTEGWTTSMVYIPSLTESDFKNYFNLPEELG